MQSLNAKLLAAVLALSVITAGAGVYAYNHLVGPSAIDEPASVDTTDQETPVGCKVRTSCCH